MIQELDFTGVPAVVDLACMRDAMNKLGSDSNKINPLVPVDLVIDHSVQVDVAKSENAVQANMELEYQRNRGLLFLNGGLLLSITCLLFLLVLESCTRLISNTLGELFSTLMAYSTQIV